MVETAEKPTEPTKPAEKEPDFVEDYLCECACLGAGAMPFQCMSKIGFRWFHENRKDMYNAMVVMTSISLILGIVAACGCSKEKGSMQKVPWAFGKVDPMRFMYCADPECGDYAMLNETTGKWQVLDSYSCTTITQYRNCSSLLQRPGPVVEAELQMFIALQGAVLKVNVDGSGSSTLKVDWDGEFCKELDAGEEDSYCDNCKDAAEETVVTAIMNVVTKLPALNLVTKRMFPETDRIGFKFLSMFTFTLGFLTSVSALKLFYSNCNDKLPDEFAIIFPEDGKTFVTGQTDYHLGVGFMCILFGTFLDVPCILINILTPVPPKEEPGKEIEMHEVYPEAAAPVIYKEV